MPVEMTNMYICLTSDSFSETNTSHSLATVIIAYEPMPLGRLYLQLAVSQSATNIIYKYLLLILLAKEPSIFY